MGTQADVARVIVIQYEQFSLATEIHLRLKGSQSQRLTSIHRPSARHRESLLKSNLDRQKYSDAQPDLVPRVD
jgi:hypothetical protein